MKVPVQVAVHRVVGDLRERAGRAQLEAARERRRGAHKRADAVAEAADQLRRLANELAVEFNGGPETASAVLLRGKGW